MLGHTPRKCQRIVSVSIDETGTSSILFTRFGTLGLFFFGYVKGKLMDIVLKLHLNFLFVFGLF
jgi:hypothetical protein